MRAPAQARRMCATGAWGSSIRWTRPTYDACRLHQRRRKPTTPTKVAGGSGGLESARRAGALGRSDRVVEQHGHRHGADPTGHGRDVGRFLPHAFEVDVADEPAIG